MDRHISGHRRVSLSRDVSLSNDRWRRLDRMCPRHGQVHVGHASFTPSTDQSVHQSLPLRHVLRSRPTGEAARSDHATPRPEQLDRTTQRQVTTTTRRSWTYSQQVYAYVYTHNNVAHTHISQTRMQTPFRTCSSIKCARAQFVS